MNCSFTGRGGAYATRACVRRAGSAAQQAERRIIVGARGHKPCAPQVGYGSFHFHRQTGGLVAIHSLKNPAAPENVFFTTSGAVGGCRGAWRRLLMLTKWRWLQDCLRPQRTTAGSRQDQVPPLLGCRAQA